MTNASQAYAKTAQTTASPRHLEADALLKAAAQLQQVLDNWDGQGRQVLDAALLFNRRLWIIFASCAAADDSTLPVDLRQNIANLGIFMLKRIVELGVNPTPEKIQPLIDINRNVAAGLRGHG